MWWIWVVIGVVIGIPLLMLLLLCIPMYIVFQFDKELGWEPRLKLKWLFVGKDLLKEKQSKKVKIDKNISNQRKGLAVLWNLVESGESRRKLLKSMKEMVSHLHISKSILDFQMGLTSPFETGMLFAALSPVISGINRMAAFNLQIIPDFDQSGIRGHGDFSARVIPLTMIVPVTRLALSPLGRKTIRVMRQKN